MSVRRQVVSQIQVVVEEQSLTGLALVERREEVVAATFARVTAIVDSSDAATLPPSLRVHHVNGSMFGFLADDGQKIFRIIVTSKTNLRRTGFDILLCCLSPTLTQTALSLAILSFIFLELDPVFWFFLKISR